MTNNNNDSVERGLLTKEEILQSLKQNGLRITEQRKLLVDIITEEDYTCCKEVYLLAHDRDPAIGIATVYRMINVLEQIGAISRKNLQKNECTGRCCDMKGGCTVVTEASKEILLSEDDLQEAIKYIMKKKGYTDQSQIKALLVDQG